MTSRVLPTADWATRLVGTELEMAVPYLPPDTQVLVVEDGAVVVGCWAVMRYVHVEGIWIHPRYRRHGAVIRRLLTLMYEVAGRVFGVRVVLTGALTDEIAALCERIGGTQLPGVTFALPVKED